MTIEEAVARRAPLAHGASLFQRGILMAVKVVRRRELTFWERLYIPQILCVWVVKTASGGPTFIFKRLGRSLFGIMFDLQR